MTTLYILSSSPFTHVDVCKVIGGGTAGNAIATRLALDPAGYSVAVVETGSFYELDNSNRTTVAGYDYYAVQTDTPPSFVNYDIPTVPQAGYNNRTIQYPQGRTFGGRYSLIRHASRSTSLMRYSSVLNYMAYHRPTIGSMQMWADAVEDQDWTWDNVLPFFKKSVNFHPPDYSKINPQFDIQYDESVLTPPGGPIQLSYGNHMFDYGLALQDGFETIGIAAINGSNAGSLIGYGPQTFTLNPVGATRDSSKTSFLEFAMQNTNIKIYQRTTAKRILFDGNKKATGVVVEMQGIHPTAQYTLSARREVIVSAGAFHSPQLLMVSGIGPLATLKDLNIPIVAESEGVGQNMWDQPWISQAYKTTYETQTQLILNNPNVTATAVNQYLTKQSGLLAGIGGGESAGWEKLPFPSRGSLSNTTRALFSRFPSDWPELEFIPLAYSATPENVSSTDHYMTAGACLVAPLSRGDMTIVSNDTNDHPVIDPAWMTHPGDMEMMVQAFKRVREWVNASGVAIEEYGSSADVRTDAQIVEWIRENGGAMGPSSNPAAVLDSHARVRGVTGLRVVDASAFPFCPPGHPMATVYMLAEKIADYISRGE
ncbi:MAG: hypothetical protein Q9196_005208 [Gyalolechia fulgens]